MKTVKHLRHLGAFAALSLVALVTGCLTSQPPADVEYADELTVGAQAVTAGPASAVLANLGVRGVTSVGGTTNHVNYLVKLNADGELPAAVIPANATDLTPLSRTVIVDQTAGDDGTGDGSAQAPYATLAGAWADATGPATYVFTPGDHFVPGSTLTTDAKFPFTLLALDPSNTTMYRVSGGATTSLPVSTSAKAANITVVGVKMAGVSQLANFALNVTVANMGAVTNMTRVSATYAYSLTHDATVTTVPTLGANATTNRLDNASRVEFAPSDSGSFGAASMTTKAALDKLMLNSVNLTNELDATQLSVVNAGNLSAGTLLAARMPALTGDVTSSAGAVATTIASGAVTSAKILDGTVAAADMAASSVVSASILDGTIAAADLAANSVASANIVDSTITAADMAADSVTTAKILDGTVAAADLATDSVTAAKILNGTIGLADIGTLSGAGATLELLSTDNAQSSVLKMGFDNGAIGVFPKVMATIQAGDWGDPQAYGYLRASAISEKKDRWELYVTDLVGAPQLALSAEYATDPDGDDLTNVFVPYMSNTFLRVADYTFPFGDGAAGTAITTDGAGNLAFTAVDDTWKSLALNGAPGASNVGDTWVYNHGTTSFDLKHVDNRVVPIVYATTIGATSPLNMTAIAYTNTWVTITINDNGNTTAGATVVLGQSGSVYPQYLTVSNKDLTQTLSFTPSVSGDVHYIYPGTTAHFVNRSSANTFDHVLVSPDYAAVPAVLTVRAPGSTLAGAQLSVPTAATAYLNLYGDSDDAAGATLAAITVTDINSLAGSGSITFKSDLDDATGRMTLGVAGATSAATIYSDSRIVLGAVKLSGATETETQGLTMSSDADDGTSGDQSLTGVLLYRKTTTDATPFALTSAQCAYASQYFAGLALPANSTCTATVTVTAKQRSSANSSSYVYIASATNNAGTSALEGANTVVREVEDTAGWGAAVTVDDTLDAFLVTLTGEAATTIDWTVKVEYTLDISGP